MARWTLCITIAANIAKTGILMFDACFPDSVVGFLAKETADIEFVRFWLSFLQASLEERAPESAQKNINLEILRGLDIPVPPLELRRHFTARVGEVQSANACQRASLSALNALFASLQHRGFMYVRKEAVLSSQIEGTQSSLQDLLAAEAKLFELELPKDVDERKGNLLAS